MAQPTEFQRSLELLRSNMANSVLGSYRSLTNAGITSAAELAEALAPQLLSGALEGEAMGRAELARMLARIEGLEITDVLPEISELGSSTVESKQRALETALSKSTDPQRQYQYLMNLVNNDSTEAAQHALSLSMRNSNRVAGYVRVLESDHCELCGWLYRDGYIYPPDRPLTTHPGCICSARPVTPSEIVDQAQRRYGSSNTRHGQRQMALWNQRAEVGARGGSSPAAWSKPPEDGNRDNDLTAAAELP